VTHDSEAVAAAYLAGELPEPERDAFEKHLLDCDPCWTDVAAARRGRLYASMAREHAPPALRHRVLEAAAAGVPPQRRGTARRLLVAAAVAVVALVAVSVGLRTFTGEHDHDEQPPVVAAALAGYRDQQLPGTAVPANPAPDLSALRLVGVAAAAGRLDRLPVEGYVYRDDAGRRLLVYVAAEQFPVPYDGEQIGGGDLWMGRDGAETLLCARRPRNIMIIGTDERLVRAAAGALRLS
jgi:Putative zinc-finger